MKRVDGGMRVDGGLRVDGWLRSDGGLCSDGGMRVASDTSVAGGGGLLERGQAVVAHIPVVGGGGDDWAAVREENLAFLRPLAGGHLNEDTSSRFINTSHEPVL